MDKCEEGGILRASDSYYESEVHLDEYEALTSGHAGLELVERLASWLPPGSEVLELGMGPGHDFKALAERYRVTGSDSSRLFLARARRRFEDAELLELDAASLESERLPRERVFDAIYSNKVLHHLEPEELERSFLRQAERLVAGGLALHSFWRGTERFRAHGLLFQHYTEDSLRAAVPPRFECLCLERYSELEEGDSLVVVLRRL